jgi:hypothetical protein
MPKGPEEIEVWESKENCVRRQKCYLEIKMIEVQWFRVLAKDSTRIFVTSAFGI